MSLRIVGHLVASPPGALVVLLLGCFALNVTWLVRFRLGYVTGWDESGYMAVGLRDSHALLSDGPVALFREFERQSFVAPLVPLLTVPITVLFGAGVFQSLLVIPVFATGLTLATFALARQVTSGGWALLAALGVAALPVVTDYSRLYHFAVPAATFFTASIWALLRSNHLQQRRWVLLSGLFAGLMLLARTMTVAYLPGLILIAAAQLLTVQHERRQRALSFVGAGLVTCVVAGSWYVRNWRTVFDYLLGSGYGESSKEQGPSALVFSWLYWSKELRLVLDEIYLPFAAALAVCFLATLVTWIVGRGWKRLSPPQLSVLSGGAFALVVIVIEGYLALTSSRNIGTAFALPWLPALVVAATVAAARTPGRGLRIGLAIAVAGVSLSNLLMKSGWIESLAKPRGISIPALDFVTVSDGRGPIQNDILGAGYPINRVTAAPAPLHRRWLPFAREVTGWMSRYAARRGQSVHVLVASNELFFNQNQITLADAIWLHRNVAALWIGGDSTPSTDVASYRERIGAWPANFLITTQAGLGAVGAEPTLNQLKITAAARSLGFRTVRRFTMPDGRLVWLWWAKRSAARAR